MRHHWWWLSLGSLSQRECCFTNNGTYPLHISGSQPRLPFPTCMNSALLKSQNPQYPSHQGCWGGVDACGGEDGGCPSPPGFWLLSLTEISLHVFTANILHQVYTQFHEHFPRHLLSPFSVLLAFYLYHRFNIDLLYGLVVLLSLWGLVFYIIVAFQFLSTYACTRTRLYTCYSHTCARNTGRLNVTVFRRWFMNFLFHFPVCLSFSFIVKIRTLYNLVFSVLYLPENLLIDFIPKSETKGFNVQ